MSWNMAARGTYMTSVDTLAPRSGHRSNVTQQSSRGSLFTNFEDVQLTDEERVYLNAAAMGDVPIIRQSLEEENDVVLNVNCVDYMGRSALHLAVDSENLEAIELLLDRMNFKCIEEALLHAISKGATKIVKVFIEHPNYMADEDRSKRRTTENDPFFRTEEKSQFSPDVTPLILAAQYNNHEIVQMFLSRNHTIERPHLISCRCADCVTKQNYDSLKRSRSRLNAYRALASPAYMALSSHDPIMSTFELRQEMKKLAQVEKEFKNEYLGLVEQCMNFAYELMDLCRGTQEVEAVLSECREQDDAGDPLARLKMALEYEEKKFVAHPNCQQHLTSIWFGPEMGFMQSLALWKKIIIWVLGLPLVPIFCMFYIISPNSKFRCGLDCAYRYRQLGPFASKDAAAAAATGTSASGASLQVGDAMRCPATKFITHTLSNLSFLILLATATFRLDDRSYPINSVSDLIARRFDVPLEDQVDCLLRNTFRPANVLMTNIQICILFWILGMLWTECKQMYMSGLRVYLLDSYNWIDFIVLSLYLASYVLRFLVEHRVAQAEQYYNGSTARSRDALLQKDYQLYETIVNETFANISMPVHRYFMTASRFEWKLDDPEIVSDMLLALANVWSIARTTYLMPAFEVLGPLQISLGRMLGDITRFLVLFTLVLLAFMVGLHNLYWYYGMQTYEVNNKVYHSTEAFQGLSRTLYSLFWSMFGLVNVDSVEIKYEAKDRGSRYASTFPGGSHATSIVEAVGMFLFALYHVAIIIVLVNMLIAMMSHSFEAIQGDCDVEWKFARTRLWMNYIDVGNTLPVPFNMIPTPKAVRSLYRAVTALITKNKDDINGRERNKRQTFIKKRRNKVCESLDLESPDTSYGDILQRLVRRYLFKLERQKDEGKDGLNVGSENILAGATTVCTDFSAANGERNFADIDKAESGGTGPPEYHSAAATLAPNSDFSRSRRLSIRPGSGPGGVSGRTMRSLPSSGSNAVSAGGGGPAQVQLLSIPQLDIIQRTLKILDVRLQHVQTNVKSEEKTRQDIQHIRIVMSENQKALSTVVSVLGSLQDEVHSLGVALHRQQANTFTIQPSIASSGPGHHATAQGAANRKKVADQTQRPAAGVSGAASSSSSAAAVSSREIQREKRTSGTSAVVVNLPVEPASFV